MTFKNIDVVVHIDDHYTIVHNDSRKYQKISNLLLMLADILLDC